MMFLRVDRLRKHWWVRSAMIALALLVLATGLCLFDQGEGGSGGHVTPPDLCLGMLAISLAIMPFVGLLAAGSAVELLFTPAYAVVRHVPDPPPKPTSLF